MGHNRKTSWTAVVALLAFASLAPAARADDAKFGVRGGFYTEAEGPFLGAELLFRVAPRFYFNPNVEYAFGDGTDVMTWNADFHYDFHARGRSFAWVGAGLAIVTTNPEGAGDSDTDPAANFLAGIGVRTGSLIPYVQAKLIAKDHTEFVLAFGLRF